eukprot:TRINITY_DN18744_c0_g1_i2.p1 TRINITY_DN18744_c0_g1~~TRINITY_DN18744_c0_g1_i2.p1  ORF type:complete len:255 (-),score=93.66 TRINITY_DN18744_c0_g1_i2:188-952(-)
MEYVTDSEGKREEVNVADSDRGEYVGRLEARIRELATRLHKMETEKLQSKKMQNQQQSKFRAQEKSPSKETISELSALRAKVDKLSNENRRLKSAAGKSSEPPVESEEKLLSRIVTLEKEKADIDESLRAEVLDNEEKRNYIEILKEALEARIEDLGLKDLLLKSVDEGNNINEVFTKLVGMKKEADEKYNEIGKCERNMVDMERTIVNLRKQAEDLSAELNNARSKNIKLANENEESTKRVQELIQKVGLVNM